jgi:hypothetical protein
MIDPNLMVVLGPENPQFLALFELIGDSYTGNGLPLGFFFFFHHLQREKYGLALPIDQGQIPPIWIDETAENLAREGDLDDLCL